MDLLSFSDQGGCSAKLSAKALHESLSDIPFPTNDRLWVGSESSDDAGVYLLNESTALIQTTDFFTPMCSDPYEFGQIAAANALSDVYAMGGEAITVLNLAAFPAKAPLHVLRDIFRGGADKVSEAGAVVAGGHTIEDAIPKFGLAVTGVVHPSQLITNAKAKVGDDLILTKPIGASVIMAGHKLGLTSHKVLQSVLDSMKQLNRAAAQIMVRHQIQCATDITGFGLLGHALNIAKASDVCLHFHPEIVPLFEDALALAETGCIPGACFRNLDFAGEHTLNISNTEFALRMLLHDPQTSGGLLICCPPSKTASLIGDLIDAGYTATKAIGNVQMVKDHMFLAI